MFREHPYKDVTVMRYHITGNIKQVAQREIVINIYYKGANNYIATSLA